MVHFLRHAAIRLWMTNLIGATVGIVLFSLLKPDLGPIGAPIGVAVLLAAIFVALGWMANRIGLKHIRHLARLAGTAERQGLHAEAETGFRGALAALDSFLLSPAVRRRYLPPLAGRMARFYLGRNLRDSVAEGFVAAFLARHPGDVEVAEQWIRHIQDREEAAAEYEELAARLGAAHPGNTLIQHGLARFYLMLERTDYTALQSYRRLWDSGGVSVPPEFCTALAALLRREGRHDEWARQVCLHAGERPPVPEVSDAAPVYPGKPLRTAPEKRAFSQPEPEPEDSGEEAFRMSPAADEPDDDAAEESRQVLWRPVRLNPGWVSGSARLFRPVLQKLAQGLRRSVAIATPGRVLTLPAARFALLLIPFCAIAAAGVWMALAPGEVPAPPTAPAAEPTGPADSAAAVDTGPYTLQVAAYLKLEYALKFVEDLKKKGIDAYWTETASGDKRWYQVRISHFPDAAAARDFGRRLKQQGAVDDFYVTNTGR
jgi:septal ring-binding cell division protein DamX